MNKQSIVELMTNVIEGETITKKEAELQLKRVLAAFKDGLRQDGKVQLVGDLSMEVKDTKERSGEMTMEDGSKKSWNKPAGKTVKCKLADKFVKEVVGE